VGRQGGSTVRPSLVKINKNAGRKGKKSIKTVLGEENREKDRNLTVATKKVVR